MRQDVHSILDLMNVGTTYRLFEILHTALNRSFEIIYSIWKRIISLNNCTSYVGILNSQDKVSKPIRLNLSPERPWYSWYHTI